MIFRGSGVALVTPFTKDNVYEINYDKLKELVYYHIKNGSDAIIVGGTTGESATMSDYEKQMAVRCAVTASNGRVPIIAGSGTNDTIHAIKLSKEAEEAGADALLVVTPYYNKCTQKGLIDYYSKIAMNVSIPIIMYNVPSRTGVNMMPETVLELSKISNIVGIKEASGNLEQIKKIIDLVKENNNDFAVYSGNDDQIYDVLDLGGDGVISVLANIFPKETSFMCHKYFEGKKDICNKYQKIYNPLIKELFSEVNPIPVKAVMNNEGFDVGGLRSPLTEIEEEHKLKLIKEYKNVE